MTIEEAISILISCFPAPMSIDMPERMGTYKENSIDKMHIALETLAKPARNIEDLDMLYRRMIHRLQTGRYCEDCEEHLERLREQAGLPPQTIIRPMGKVRIDGDIRTNMHFCKEE